MNTLAVVSQKGGCGKTTIAVNLAACIAACGDRVLLIDMDPQGHAAMALGISPDNLELTTYHSLTDNDAYSAPISETVLEAGECLWLAPSNILLSSIEQQLSGKKGREDRLRNRMVEVASSYEYCIIDCPPIVGILTMNALRAAQVALIPMDMSCLSLQGVVKMLETIRVLSSRTAHFIRPKIVANRSDARTRLTRSLLTTLRRNFGDRVCKTVIKGTIQLAEAAMNGLPIRQFAPYSSAHEDFADLALEITMHPELFDSPATFPARVLFSYHDPNAREVILAGDFNDWVPSEQFRLLRERDGRWSLSVPLPAGTYRYKFIVDGTSREDPANPNRQIGTFGQTASVLNV